MSVEKQLDFAYEQLKAVAMRVGINLDESFGGLRIIHDEIAGWQQDFSDCEDDYKEADRLKKRYGDSQKGWNVLYSLGEACNFTDGSTFAVRESEQALYDDPMTEANLTAAGWGSHEERGLVDFCFYVGIAAHCCFEYANKDNETPGRDWFANIGSRGGVARHEPMRKLNAWAVNLYRSKNYRSARAASIDLKDAVIAHGRTINAVLAPDNAQRTLYQWLLAADKALPPSS